MFNRLVSLVLIVVTVAWGVIIVAGVLHYADVMR